MIIKGLCAIEKCTSKLLQTCSAKSLPKIAMGKGLTTDVIQIGKKLENISFVEFGNILKRNGITEFVAEDYLIKTIQICKNLLITLQLLKILL